MKKSESYLKFIAIILMIFVFSNCNRIKLTNEDAKILIVKTLSLPIQFHDVIIANSMDPLGEGAKVEKLEGAGFIHKRGGWASGYTLYVTNKGQPYLLSNEKDHINGGNKLTFKSFDVDFNEITGIAINKEQETATVRFSLKSTNVTLIGSTLQKNIENPRNGELIYKKFDNGWQLESNPNKSGIDLVKEIWWGPKN